MEDKFESFIRDQREAFDFREVDPALWKKIEADIKPGHMINWKLILGRAAAVLIIFAASYLVHDLIDNHGRIAVFNKHQSKAEPEIVIPELQEAELYYSGLISEKLEEVRPILASCPGVEEELNTDMTELDSLYTSLKADLKDNVANQEVIEAIIENYRLRIALLEELLAELKPEEGMCVSKISNYEL
jgi:hypothetical protein